MDSTTFNVMMAVENPTFVVVGCGSTFWGPWSARRVSSACPNFLRTLREWLESCRTPTRFLPDELCHDSLDAFLDFENAKRLIVYGLILIVMMIVRPTD